MEVGYGQEVFHLLVNIQYKGYLMPVFNSVGSGYLIAANAIEGQYPILLVAFSSIGGTTYYFTNCNEEYVWALPPGGSSYPRVQYYRLNLKLSEYSTNTNFELPRLTLTVGSLPGTFLSLIRSNNGIRGYSVSIMRTFRHLIGESIPAYTEEVNRAKLDMYVDATKIGDTSIEFTLSTLLEIANIDVPKRRFYKDYCSRTYRSFNPTGADASTNYENGYCYLAGQTDGTNTCQKSSDTCLNAYYFTGCIGIPSERQYIV